MDCGLDYAQLGAAGALRYAWSPGSSLSDSTDQFVHARPAENTLYTVLGTDNWGCSNTDSVLIRVFSGSGRLFAPEAFTPNQDGKNDCYRVNIPGDVSDYDFSIYNRWGQQVFQTTDYFQCWDGTYNNNVAELGTYFYFYKATSTICDGVSGKGSLHLIR
jgi:gliding motility-associated-like protein